MKKILAFLLTALTMSFHSDAQVYSDYVGAGQSQDVTVTSSDPQSNGIHSVNGTGLDLDIQGASRFLAHASMGATIDDIQYVAENGIEFWVDEQLSSTPTFHTQSTIDVVLFLYDECLANLGDECNNVFNTNQFMWRYSFWDNTMKAPDQLRQRVALALSEILVVSDRSDLQSYPWGIANYYDVLVSNAFGNYHDLLMDMTLHPSMGYYLSHINNPRTLPDFNIHPDENYAREIMQLFTIGLYELNQDGSRKIDPATGEWIPTYDNDDITELAKVFTGLSGSQWADENNSDPVQFGFPFQVYSLLDPMTMYPIWHEPGPKTIVGNHVILGGQSGMKDIEDAVAHLFYHDNTAPFVCLRLIQRLVKSNPSPDYISRITLKFNDNGQGIRGDLEAVVKAILLDPEAMECYWLQDDTQGQLREPFMRQIQLFKGLRAQAESEEFWNSSAFYEEWTGQHPMSSSTVFNFYMPDYVPDDDFESLDLVGPEYQILNTSTSANYVNWMMIGLLREYINDRYNVDLPNIINEGYVNAYVADTEYYEADLTDPLWLSLVEFPAELVDYLDILLANGQLTEETKSKMVSSMNSSLLDLEAKARYALFMVMINPDFVIMK